MDVVLWGAAGHAKVLRECLAHSGHPVVAVVDNDASVQPPWEGAELLRGGAGLDAWLSNRSGDTGFLVAVGGDRGADRLALHRSMLDRGLVALEARHPSAFVAASVEADQGLQVLAQAAVAVDVRLGRCVIVNTGATVDHECRLGDGVHVGPGAHLAGVVTVGDRAFIGTGAVVLPRVAIGTDAVVGAGAVVLRDVPAGARVVGNPAREIS